MGLILLEALGAMVLLILIVWWTMFSGRKNGELVDDKTASKDPAADPAQDHARDAADKP